MAPQPTKPGYQTTEFWVSALTVAGVIATGTPQGELIAGGVAAVYAMVRGYTKGRG